MPAFHLLAESDAFAARALALAQQLHLPFATTRTGLTHFLLLDQYGLSIQIEQMHWQPDLVGGRVGFRRAHGGGSKEPIARACGVKPGVRPSILDGTGGWLRDAFVLASVGCHVTAVERHAIVFALMQDALQRAAEVPELSAIVACLTLQHAVTENVLSELAGAAQHDVIYLDPMFPPREKTAQVKKDMQILQALADADLGASLLPLALNAAKKRVVVKRPDYAPPLAALKPNHIVDAGANRFDIYLI